MTDVGVAVTNLRVVCKIIGAVCKTIACVPAVTEIFSRCKRCCWSGHSELQATRRNPFWTLAMTLRVAGYAKESILDACHRTNDGQEHKIIWRAGPEQDFLLTCHSVQRARQPLSRRAISLGSFTGAVDFVLQLIRL